MSRFIEIKFPQICVGTRIIEVPDGEYPEDGCSDELVDFIWNHMTEDEKDDCPNRKKGIDSCLDQNLAHVKEIKNQKTE